MSVASFNLLLVTCVGSSKAYIYCVGLVSSSDRVTTLADSGQVLTSCCSPSPSS